MRLPDSSVHLAWNVQVATATSFSVALEPSGRPSGQAPGGRLHDRALAVETVGQIERRCGKAPQRLLADGTAITQGEIDRLSRQHPGLKILAQLIHRM